MGDFEICISIPLIGFADQLLVTFKHVILKRFSSDLVFACDNSLLN